MIFDYFDYEKKRGFSGIKIFLKVKKENRLRDQNKPLGKVSKKE